VAESLASQSKDAAMTALSDSPSGDDRKGGNNEATENTNRRVPAPKPLTVSVKNAEKLTDLGHTKIYELLGDGTIESVKVGNKRLIVFASLERLTTPSKQNEALENPTARATAARVAKRAKTADDAMEPRITKIADDELESGKAVSPIGASRKRSVAPWR
jgi:excisionase family DNA binding protein